ncbi:DUF4439 domain-containing protein [Streptacidiphilus sp. MAP12-16]|uniref:DUF4439 domain-containing protein n=1 Tax=Streptacidiphilus sp. MAP12-16 TaxID=3156300 RepID=UPI0035126C96
MTFSVPGPRRRALLGVGLIGLLSACSDTTARSTTPTGGRPARSVDAADPDTPVRTRSLRATEALIARYDATLTGYPALGTTLHPLRVELAAHASALGISATPTAGASANPGPTASSGILRATSQTASQTATGTPVPGTRTAALAALASAERTTAQGRTADLLTASPALARLLASIAASGAQHAVRLGGSAPATSAAAPLTTTLPPAALAALQAALAAEDAAVYGYGVIGAQLDGDRRAQADAAYQAHRSRRGALQQRISAAGAAPAAAAPAYELPAPVTDTGSAVRLAALIEDRISAVYANAVEATTGPLRSSVATSLRQAALDTLAWSGTGSAFPGLPHG